LAGLRVLEIASLAPAPFACTVLSDLGAEVLRIDRAPAPASSASAASAGDPLSRGRRSVAMDLKHPGAAETVLRLVERADVFVEGFRPGVCERLGIGPEPCLARNPRLVYARMTGYGQDGPMAQRAGHDINYLSLAGALEPLGPASGPPLPPLNFLADFGGGGMLLVVGVLAALWERERSGIGQVVDAAMVEGTAMITSILHTLRSAGLWEERRGRNLFDGSAPFYAAYECSDGRFVAVGALEPQFWAELLDGLGLPDAAEMMERQLDRDSWAADQARLAAIFRTRTRDEWAAQFAESDGCLTPVLGPFEAHEHPHNIARGTFVAVEAEAAAEVGGEQRMQPGPAPRFSRTPGRVGSSVSFLGGDGDGDGDGDRALGEWGLSSEEVGALRTDGVFG
jgi:alpha-methylacyl-CoA racemase